MQVANHSPNDTQSMPWKPSVINEVVKVLINQALTPEYRHLVVACGAGAAQAKAGQFFQLLCPSKPGEVLFLRRPMSVFRADPARNIVEFLYKVTGIGTRGLETLKPDDTLDIVGPLGNGFSIDPALRSIVLVARGAGMATLAPVAEEASAMGVRVTALFSAKRSDLMLLEDLVQSFGADVITVTDLDGTSKPARVEALLRKLIEDGHCDAFYTCGSARLIRIQQRLLQEYGLSGQAAIEEQMACGLGLCFCCVRDFDVAGERVGRRVCAEGPVFDLKEVAIE